MQTRWRLPARPDMRIVSPCHRPRNVLHMPSQMHADAGRFRRSCVKRDLGTQKQEAGGGRKTAAHDGLLHDFVRVPRWCLHFEGRFDRSGNIKAG